VNEVRVALTFDAEHAGRPDAVPDGAARILALLDEGATPATFFLQGRWASAHPDTARRIAESGHRIGSHSTAHERMTRLSDDGLREDVLEAAQRIVDATGIDPTPWFRCPYGDGHDDDRVLGILRELGYRDVHWHVDPMDWETGRDAGDVSSAIIEGVGVHGDGTVVLLHTWPGPTARALRGALDALQASGVSFVTVDALEALP
jgi:peptidoglycan/xylan/chitin deacetylase (PgdA/CDA1 family)